MRWPAVTVALAAAALAAPAGAQTIAQPASPRATVVMVPGSGFNGARVRNALRMSFKEDVWRSWGFRTKVAPYRRGKAGLVDVTRVVRRAVRETPGLPLCVYGESSGGTWALLVATRVADVDCVIALAAPTDQETLARAADYGAQHLARTVWPRYFGSSPGDDVYEPFDVWSASAPPPIPVLAVYSDGDTIVPAQQGELFAPISGFVELRVLPRGRHSFVHAKVDTGAFVRARRAALQLVAGVSPRSGR